MKIVGKVEDDKDRVGQQNYKTVAGAWLKLSFLSLNFELN